MHQTVSNIVAWCFSSAYTLAWITRRQLFTLLYQIAPCCIGNICLHVCNRSIVSFTFCANFDHSSLKCNFYTGLQSVLCPSVCVCRRIYNHPLLRWHLLRYVLMSKVNVSIWSALCSVYRVCILSLIVIISCTNLHNWNNCLHRQHSVYYDVFFIVYVAFENYPMCFSLYALFTILSVSLLNFLRKFTQLEYLLYIEKLIHQHMLQTQRSLPVLCFHCPRTLDTISIFVPVVVSLSPFLAPVYTIWILCCVYKLVHCHLLHAAHSLCITVFFIVNITSDRDYAVFCTFYFLL